MTTVLERATETLWKGGAARIHFGTCDDCGRNRDDNGRRLLVARQTRCRRFQCLACFSLKPSGGAR